MTQSKKLLPTGYSIHNPPATPKVVSATTSTSTIGKKVTSTSTTNFKPPVPHLVNVPPSATQSEAELIKMLNSIQSRVNTTPVLNDGYNTLILKVDNIETAQASLVQTTNEIKEDLYDPDNGLYSRLATLKNSMSVVSDNISDIKNHQSLLNAQNCAINKLLEEKYSSQQKTIEEVKAWKTNVNGVLKWAAAAVGGATLAAILKTLFDALTFH